MKDRYIVAFRGTNDISDFIQDIGLTIGINLQENDLLQFVESIKPFLQSQTKPIIFVGHSLGGALAQLSALSFATAESANISFQEKK